MTKQSSTEEAEFVPAPSDVLIGHVDDVETQWSIGTLGAIAEFSRDAAEPTVRSTRDGTTIATECGALRIHARDDVRLIATETLGRAAGTWRNSVSVCLPHAAACMHARAGITEIGPDSEAARAQDRDGILFDLGLELPQTDVCVRTSNPALIAVLRANLGKPVFGADHAALLALIQHSPHRIFLSRLGRIEVFQNIPEATGKSPIGPHTHLLPKLLRAGRTHAATVPIPDEIAPCAVFYPPHPLFDGEGMPRPFVRAHFESFERLLARFGQAGLVAVQDAVRQAVREGRAPSSFKEPSGKFERASLRIALRKMRAAGEQSATLEQWLQAFDRVVPEEDAAEEAAHAC